MEHPVTRSQVESFAQQHLQKLKVRENQAQFLCPFHDDRNPSGSINLDNGRWQCFACGEKGDLFSLAQKLFHVDFPAAKELVLGKNGRQRLPRKRAEPKPKGTIVAVYPYTDEAGKLLYEKVRLEPKDFYIRRADGKPGLGDTRRVLYRLPEVVHAETVLLCEGEKDCDTAAPLGFVATWTGSVTEPLTSELLEPLRGKGVAIVADNDPTGEAFAQKAAHALHGIARSVKIVRLPSGKDLSDWVATGGTADQLRALIAETPEFSSATERTSLLREMERFLTRFVALPPHTILPLAVWVIGTHCFELFDSYAYLGITSPAPHCGKTRLLEVFNLLCAEPWFTVPPSEAALFRGIAELKPTLLLDEVDIFRNPNSERAQWLLAILNSGYKKGATVARCSHQGGQLERYQVYCPKAFAFLKQLPSSLAGRTIPIRMHRKKAGDRVERLVLRRVAPEAKALTGKIAEVVQQSRERIKEIYEQLEPLEFLEDREEELWGPLFAIVSEFDSCRLEEIKADARALSQAKSDRAVEDSLGSHLLADIRRVWPDGSPSIPSQILCSRLKGIEDGPWDEEVELTPRKLARMLRAFDISPRTIRQENATPKGYVRVDFLDAFALYVPSDPPHPPQVNNDGPSEAENDPPQDPLVADRKN